MGAIQYVRMYNTRYDNHKAMMACTVLSAYWLSYFFDCGASYDDVCTTQFKHTINDIIHRVLWVLPVICFEIAYTPSIPKWNRISLDLKNVSVNNMHSYTAVFFIDVGTFSGIRDFFNIKYGILSSLSPFSIATTFVINYENMHQERIVVGIWFAMSEMHRSCAIAKSEIPHSYHHSCLSLLSYLTVHVLSASYNIPEERPEELRSWSVWWLYLYMIA